MTIAEDGRETLQELRSIDVLSFFDSELRPIFCLDTQQDNTSDNLKPVYSNTFLRVSGIWPKLVPPERLRLPKDDPSWGFIRWAQATSQTEVGSDRQMRYEGIHWSKTTILDRWRVVCGTVCSDDANTAMVRQSETKLEAALQDVQKVLLRGVLDSGYREASSADSISEEADDGAAFDRGQVIGDSEMHLESATTSASETASQHEKWFATYYDSIHSDLGPRKSWSPTLQRLCGLIMADDLPAAIHWGPERYMIYNEAYQWILGRKHPKAMGQPFTKVWAETVESVLPVFDLAASTGKAFNSDDTEFHVNRNGFLEQTYFAWSMLPLFEDDQLLGFYNPVRETTKQKLLYRRMSLLLGLSQRLSRASITSEFWPLIANALDEGTHDVPLLLIYAGEGIDDNTTAILDGDTQETRRWDLKGTVGYPKDLDKLPLMIDFDNPDEFMTPFVSRVEHATEPITISTTDGSFPACMMTSVHIRSYGEKCSQAVVCPIRPSLATSMSAAGFFVLGLNPRREYDDDYKLFAELLMRQIASSMASVLLVADSLERGKQRAEILSKELATQTKLAADNEVQFQTMAENAPVGIFEMKPDGSLKYSNSYYRKLVSPEWDDGRIWTYRDAAAECELDAVEKHWQTLTQEKRATNAEVRLKRKWTSPDGEECTSWVVAAAYPQLRPDGELASVFGCLTEISQQKWAEKVQARRTEHAIELKRQQEMFIDMTSHELRNPLSAIIQSADSILASFDHPDIRTSEQPSFTASDIAGAIDAAQTIVFCAQHQKRISDDVLILSKLNSNIVVITPVDVKPAEVVLNGLRVFDRELKKSGIQLSMHAQPSFYELEIGSIRLDPGRMLQVLINLVSNSIKFTETQHRREINVRFGASLTEHFEELKHIQFWDKDSNNPQLNRGDSAHADEKEAIYLYLSVEDTGRGLQRSELEILFQRFQQATPRTHIQYGGSGLGLFISKKLAEAQGGAIGVSSTPGEGSTFAFYIKAYRSSPNASPQPVAAPVSHTIVIGEARQIRIDASKAQVQPEITHHDESTLESPISSPLTPSDLSNLAKSAKRKSLQVQPSKQENGEILHVLIVEDNLVNQKVLAKQLDKLGYGVAIANHGVEALDHLEQSTFWKASRRALPPQLRAASQRQASSRPGLPRRRSSMVSAESDHLGLGSTGKVSVSRTSSVSSTAPTNLSADEPAAPGLKLDVILMDLEMPVMDGLTCVKRIRELQAEGSLSKVPVIAVTANARQEQITAAIDAGMDSVVCKPFRIPELVGEIKATLQRIGQEAQAAKATL